MRAAARGDEADARALIGRATRLEEDARALTSRAHRHLDAWLEATVAAYSQPELAPAPATRRPTAMRTPARPSPTTTSSAVADAETKSAIDEATSAAKELAAKVADLVKKVVEEGQKALPAGDE